MSQIELTKWHYQKTRICISNECVTQSIKIPQSILLNPPLVANVVYQPPRSRSLARNIIHAGNLGFNVLTIRISKFFL